ncbi:putative rRNA-processing protein FCF1-like [Apostichopus japonicus]|uniref:Putative rRNA-processing protein FCF1-like n=1 Tax=Stichopus japonicus TaxID=307972 RepID=A0A2G8KWX9_STIJA|nr:putative rRNA-processing protein FCF1-like [Apostichopus japonicus]
MIHLIKYYQRMRCPVCDRLRGGELEKLGRKFNVALRLMKDERIERLPCIHKGTYADDCLVDRVTQHKCYIVGTCDRDLKRRIRKIPGVPIMFITKRRAVLSDHRALGPAMERGPSIK